MVVFSEHAAGQKVVTKPLHCFLSSLLERVTLKQLEAIENGGVLDNSS
jgi:hypothetical protein